MKMKPWIITGVSLLCAGAICCGAAVHAGALDQKRYMKMLDLTDYTDTPDGAFSSVLMDIESADVTVQNGSALPSPQRMSRRTATASPSKMTLCTFR